MPRRFLERCDPLIVKAMEEAFNNACDALGLQRTKDGATESLAWTIVEQARLTGELDPAKLCARTLSALSNGRK